MRLIFMAITQQKTGRIRKDIAEDVRKILMERGIKFEVFYDEYPKTVFHAILKQEHLDPRDSTQVQYAWGKSINWRLRVSPRSIK